MDGTLKEHLASIQIIQSYVRVVNQGWQLTNELEQWISWHSLTWELGSTTR